MHGHLLRYTQIAGSTFTFNSVAQFNQLPGLRGLKPNSIFITNTGAVNITVNDAVIEPGQTYEDKCEQPGGVLDLSYLRIAWPAGNSTVSMATSFTQDFYLEEIPVRKEV